MSGTSSQSPAAPVRRTSRLGLLALVPLTLFVLVVSALRNGELPIEATWSWIPSLGIDLAFAIDGLSLQFLALITGVGTMVFVYAAGYMAGDPRRGRLFGFLLAFMAAMVGCVTTSNLLVLFVFWELTSVTSFMLVGYKHEYEASRKSAQQALMITGGGGLVLLVGVLLLAEIAGTYSIPTIIATAPTWQAHPWVPAALACLFLGAFTKSAQFPFHFWLPNAMAAPTPVSAYLHSATMVKLGIYLLARLHPAFSEMAIWQVPLIAIGGFTAAWAMVLAVRERDLKRILAWSTVSALGTLVMVIGLPGEGAAAAAAAFLLAHALYKAPLFFVAGNIDLANGTRDIDKLAALARRMPWTAAAALLAAASMSGLPLSFGFVAKDVIKLAKAEADVFTLVAYSGVFVGAASIAAAGVAAVRVFWHRGGRPIPEDVREVCVAMRLPPMVIGCLGIAFGLAPWLAEPLLVASAAAMQSVVEPSAIPTIEEAEAASGWTALAITMGLGVAMFVGWDRLHAAQKRVWVPRVLNPAEWYDALLRAIPASAAASTRRIQHGRLTGYAMLTVAFVVAGLGWAVWQGGVSWPAYEPPSLGVIGACIALVVAAIAVCVVRDSFLLLLVGGLFGLASALVFVSLAAPDVAFTQFAVEVAFVVVIAAILLRVRRIDRARGRVGGGASMHRGAWLRALVAIAAGTVMAVLLLASVAGSPDSVLPQFFAERSVPEAHGRNVVNVILVDFRAVDTLGEISVLAVTFLAVVPLFALLRRRREEAP
jgi:multicomponent Na+:H+ antiporter subunit A